MQNFITPKVKPHSDHGNEGACHNVRVKGHIGQGQRSNISFKIIFTIVIDRLKKNSI